MVRRIAAGLDCSAYTALDIKKLTAGDRWLRRLDGLRAVAFYLALCVFIGSLTLVGQYLYEGWQNKQQVSGLSSLYTDGKDVDVQLPEDISSTLPCFFFKSAIYVSVSGDRCEREATTIK